MHTTNFVHLNILYSLHYHFRVYRCIYILKLNENMNINNIKFVQCQFVKGICIKAWMIFDHE